MVDQYSAPAFADLNGDGRADLLLGLGDGTLAFYRNEGSSFQLVVGAADPFAGISVDGHSAPALHDLTDDDLVDLVVGSKSGGLAFFTNTGNATVPNFTKMQDVLNLIFGGILDIDFEQDIVAFSSGQP